MMLSQLKTQSANIIYYNINNETVQENYKSCNIKNILINV